MSKKPSVTGRLVIFRHGQTPYNKAHLMTGIADVPLTELGQAQAADAGRAIAHLRFDKVFASTLSRAFNTAALALEAAGTQEHLRHDDGSFMISKSKDIVELDTGDFTGRCHKTDPEIVNWGRVYDVPLPNGESSKQVVERVGRFFDEKLRPRLARGETVLVVVHAGIVRAFDIVLGIEPVPADGQEMPKRPVPNASPALFEFTDGVLTSSSQLDIPPANNNTPPDSGHQARPPKFGR